MYSEIHFIIQFYRQYNKVEEREKNQGGQQIRTFKKIFRSCLSYNAKHVHTCIQTFTTFEPFIIAILIRSDWEVYLFMHLCS